jgi:hypothetical protein
VRIEGSGATTAEYNIVKYNGDAGVGIWSRSGSSPVPTVQYSNIYGNGTTASTTVTGIDTSAILTASYTCCGSSTLSNLWTAPVGTTLRRVRLSYTEGWSYSGTYAELRNGATGAVIQTFPATVSNVHVPIPAGVTSLRVFVTDSGGSYDPDTITVSVADVEETNPVNHYDLVAVTDSGQSLAKFNFWTSTIGDVPGKIFQYRALSVDYSGYTAVEYPSGSVTQVGPRP